MYISTSVISCALALWAATPAAAARSSHRQPLQEPKRLPVPGASTSQGCYSTLGDLELAEVLPITAAHVSTGSCLKGCSKKRRNAVALHMETCYCMDEYPPLASLVDDTECNYPCPGYPFEACGGRTTYSVRNVGIKLDVKHQAGPRDSLLSSLWRGAADRLEHLWNAASELGSDTLGSLRGVASTSGTSGPDEQQPMRNTDGNPDEPEDL